MNKFSLIACGGTFDLFHAGHKSFISQILEKADKVILGLTSDLYINSFKQGNDIEPFEFRKKVLERFLISIKAKNLVQIVPIDDYYGPLLTNQFNVQTIAVTSQTEYMAIDINKKREARNLPKLKIIKLSLQNAQDGKVLSATRIRNGEINRNGRLYLNPKWQNKTLVLPENLRPKLQHPWGKVLEDIPLGIDASKTIVIGDITAWKFNQKNDGQFLSIVDFLVQRQIKFHDLSELGFKSQIFRKVKNLHGTINPQLFESIRQAFKEGSGKIILVEGEEDLAVLPVLLIAPLGFTIYYGQPNVGMVEIKVTEENKEKAYEFVSGFEY